MTAQAALRAEVSEMFERGLTVSQIATLKKCSVNRVHRILDDACAPPVPTPAEQVQARSDALGFVGPPFDPSETKADPLPKARARARGRVQVRWLVPRGLDESTTRLQYAVGPSPELAGVVSPAEAERVAADPKDKRLVFVRTVSSWVAAQ